VDDARRALTRLRVIRIGLRVLAVAALALLLRFVVIPQFVDASHDLRALQSLSPWPVLLGLALELASLAAYGALTYAVLDPRDRPGFGTVVRVDLAGVATTNVIPAGGALALAARYRMLSRAGTSATTIVGGLAVEVILSNLLLSASENGLRLKATDLDIEVVETEARTRDAGVLRDRGAIEALEQTLARCLRDADTLIAD